MNDELGSLSLQDSKKMKDITSKEWFTIREPYGRKHVKLKRIASICGTTNDIQILDDPTGNRRFLPIPVEAIDFDIFNGVDKEDVFAEFFNWYKDGIDYTLNRDHIKLIEQYTDEFNAPVQEMELFIAMFQHPKNEDYAEYLSNSQIKSYIETKYNTKISAKRLGMVLKKMGFEQKIRRVGTETVRAYAVEKKLN
jgi:predicted P-loop ATPase